MEATRYSETSVSIRESTRHHISEVKNILIYSMLYNKYTYNMSVPLIPYSYGVELYIFLWIYTRNC
jgi:hypothetical protein